METIFGSRPFSLASACVPAFAATAAQGLLGLSAVEGRTLVSLAVPAAGSGYAIAAPIAGLGASTINNSMGATDANGNGVATSTDHQVFAARIQAARIQSVQVDKVKGGDARGIPPRGWPV